HRVAAAAEVHEVQEREMLLERLRRDREALGEVAGGDHRLLLVAAGGEEVGEERLENAEPLRGDGARGPLGRTVDAVEAHLVRGIRRRAGVRLLRRLRTVEDELAKSGGLERDRAPVLPQHPAREQRQLRVLRDEDVAVDTVARLAE